MATISLLFFSAFAPSSAVNRPIESLFAAAAAGSSFLNVLRNECLLRSPPLPSSWTVPGPAADVIMATLPVPPMLLAELRWLPLRRRASRVVGFRVDDVVVLPPLVVAGLFTKAMWAAAKAWMCLGYGVCGCS
jgi:hypothetical protein